MKKRVVAAILLAMVTVTACGETTENDRGSVNETGGKEPEVTVLEPAGTAEVTPTETAEPVVTQAPEDPQPQVYDGTVRPLQIEIEKVYDGWSSDDYNYSANISAPEITLSEEQFPELGKALNNYGQALQRTAGTNDLPEMIDIAKEFQAADPEPESPVYLESDYTTTIARADTVATSLLTMQYVDYHGAHPGVVYTSKTFDSVTGKELGLYDVIAADQVDDLPQLLTDTLLEEYEDVDFFEASDLPVTISNMIGMNSGLTYTLDYFGITFYFSAYELAPYAYGAQIVTFRYEDYPDLVNAEYQVTPDSYICPLEANGKNMLPDGRILDLSIFTFGEEYEEGYAVEANLDGNPTSYEIDESFDISPWLVHCDNGDFMYLRWSTYNDYALMSVCDLNGDSVGKPQEFYGAFRGAPTDPENLKIYDRGNMLSTVTIYRYYTIGTDGMPDPKTDYFYISGDLALTLKQDLTCECRSDFDAPEDHTEEKLPKGSKITFYAQNEDEGWVDFTLPDGRFVRLYVDTSDYPRTVDGIDIDALFDGLFWAG